MTTAKRIAPALVLLTTLAAIYIYPFIALGMTGASQRCHYMYMASQRPLFGRNYLIKLVKDTPSDYDQVCAMAILLGYKETGAYGSPLIDNKLLGYLRLESPRSAKFIAAVIGMGDTKLSGDEIIWGLKMAPLVDSVYGSGIDSSTNASRMVQKKYITYVSGLDETVVLSAIGQIRDADMRNHLLNITKSGHHGNEEVDIKKMRRYILRCALGSIVKFGDAHHAVNQATSGNDDSILLFAIADEMIANNSTDFDFANGFVLIPFASGKSKVSASVFNKWILTYANDP